MAQSANNTEKQLQKLFKEVDDAWADATSGIVSQEAKKSAFNKMLEKLEELEKFRRKNPTIHIRHESNNDTEITFH